MEKISFSAALKDFDLIILNQSLNNDFDRFWAASKLRLVADGAANQLHSHNHLLTPDFVIGDFDSISDKILDYYKSKCKVLQITDQDSTDFQKCIKKILEIEQTRAVTVDRSPSLFALGALSGRLDHTISCLNTLLKFPHKRIFLISADSVATLVNPGDTEIFCHKDYEGKIV